MNSFLTLPPPPLSRFQGMYCHPLENSPLMEIGCPAHCEQCGRLGFFNIMRVTKPTNFEKFIDMGLVNAEIHVQELKPELSPAGLPSKKLCPACKLRWLDPMKFAE